MGFFDLFKPQHKHKKSEHSDDLPSTKDDLSMLSNWIFNNYGVPVSKLSNAMGNSQGIKLGVSLPFKGVPQLTTQIANEFIKEYTGLEIDITSNEFIESYVNCDSPLFLLKEEDIYTDDHYSYLETQYVKQLFLKFNFESTDDFADKKKNYNY